MSENKPIKVSLSIFLLVVAILVIAVMAYYIYIEKTNYNKEIASLKGDLQNAMSSSNKATPVNNAQTSVKENDLIEGTYAYRRPYASDQLLTGKSKSYIKSTYIKFYDDGTFIIFHPHQEETGTISGTIFGNYEKNGNDSIRCTIYDGFYFDLKIANANNLQIINKVDSIGAESESGIAIHELTSVGNEYIRFEESDIAGNWAISTVYEKKESVYKGKSSYYYSKTEDYKYKHNFTFNEDGTFEEYDETMPDEYKTYNGKYKVEYGNVCLSNNSLGLDEMVIIDSNTIAYQTGAHILILTKK